MPLRTNRPFCRPPPFVLRRDEIGSNRKHRRNFRRKLDTRTCCFRKRLGFSIRQTNCRRVWQKKKPIESVVGPLLNDEFSSRISKRVKSSQDSFPAKLIYKKTLSYCSNTEIERAEMYR